MSLTIVIPTYGRDEVLCDTIAQLLVQSPPADEILVVDQTPQHAPATTQLLTRWHRAGAIRWIRHEPPGTVGAMNRGLIEATGDVVLFLDDDIRPAPGLVGAHVRAHEGYSEAWAVVGRVLQPADWARRGQATDGKTGPGDFRGPRGEGAPRGRSESTVGEGESDRNDGKVQRGAEEGLPHGGTAGGGGADPTDEQHAGGASPQGCRDAEGSPDAGARNARQGQPSTEPRDGAGTRGSRVHPPRCLAGAQTNHPRTAASFPRVRLTEDLDFRFNGDAPAWVTNVMAGNLSVKRDRALAIGGFDASFTPPVAFRFETEFARRLVAAGGRIRFEPGASIRHLRVARGGTRSLGNHLTSASPVHGVGDYYYALRCGQGWDRLWYIVRRPLREVRTRFHLRHPWYIPVKLVGELRALLLAVGLWHRGPRLLVEEGSEGQ